MKCYLLLKLPFASTVKHFYIHNFVDSILVSDVQVSMHNVLFHKLVQEFKKKVGIQLLGG